MPDDVGPADRPAVAPDDFPAAAVWLAWSAWSLDHPDSVCAVPTGVPWRDVPEPARGLCRALARAALGARGVV